MLTITAVIRVKHGHGETMRRALLAVAENVRVNEPETIGFFVSQDPEDPCVFTTYERFVDQAAMDTHNNSEAVARFFGIAKPILDGDVVLVTAAEISAKPA
jgi:quinol monooxygenase YgiN